MSEQPPPLSRASALVRTAAKTLATAGIESPAVDARLLLAHVLAVEPGRLLLDPGVDQDSAERFAELVGRRAAREPLQHLTGIAYFRHRALSVGPGVFVPRPETEVMTGWAIDRLRELIAAGRTPRAVDLCSGSGAIAGALATEAQPTRVTAVELSADAAAYAERNLAGTGVELVVADLADALPDEEGTVDLVIANPPYIPLDAYASVPPEVRDHDPTVALFSGSDGLDAIRMLVDVAARLLVDGGLLCFEHADVQGDAAPAVVLASGEFHTVRDRPDLAGRPRFVTAVRVRRDEGSRRDEGPRSR